MASVTQCFEVAAALLAAAAGIALLPGDVEVLAGAADGDVEEAVLFVEAAFLDAAPTGEFAFYGFDDEDSIELEAFGLMDGEDADTVFVAELAFEVEAE